MPSAEEIDKYGTEPRYSQAEAARLSGIKIQSIRRWIGRSEDGPGAIRPDDGAGDFLSFFNLVELRFVGAYRDTGIPLQRVRQALIWAKEALDEPRPLLKEKFFESDGKNMFHKFQDTHTGRKLLASASESGQLAWPEVVEEHFKEIQFAMDLPVRIIPADYHRAIVIDPRVQFGLPSLANNGVLVDVIAGRLQNANQSIEEIADDFGCSPEDVHQAVRWRLNQAA